MMTRKEERKHSPYCNKLSIQTVSPEASKAKAGSTTSYCQGPTTNTAYSNTRTMPSKIVICASKIEYASTSKRALFNNLISYAYSCFTFETTEIVQHCESHWPAESTKCII